MWNRDSLPKRRYFKTGIWVLIISLFPGLSFALGFGGIKVFSYLNEPLDAEIELVGADEISLDQLLVSLASTQDFKKAELPRPYYLTKLKFEIAREDHHTFIRVKTDEVLKQPYLDFLVDLLWSQGRLVRGYTILLDPAPMGSAEKRHHHHRKAHQTALNERTPTDETELALQNQPVQYNKIPETKVYDSSSPVVQGLESLFETHTSENLTETLPLPLPTFQESTGNTETTSRNAPKNSHAAAPPVSPIPEVLEKEMNTLILPTLEDKSPRRYEMLLFLGATGLFLLAVGASIWFLRRKDPKQAAMTLAKEQDFSSLNASLYQTNPVNPISPTVEPAPPIIPPLPLLEQSYGTAILETEPDRPNVLKEEITLKLTLAQYYIDIQDIPNAKDILEDILSKAGETEKEVAKLLLSKIASN